MGDLIVTTGLPRLEVERSIEALMADPALRERKGALAQKAARDFHIDRYAERHLELYEECLSAPDTAAKLDHPGIAP